jgi:hypothetical protein
VTRPLDERTTYFLGFIDCLPWVEDDATEFWMDQLVFALQSIDGSMRNEIVKSLWDCISGEMGGERGLKAIS